MPLHVYLNADVIDAPEAAEVRALVGDAIACTADCRVLKDQPDGRVVAVPDGDRTWVVKLYAVGAVKAWLYGVVRRSRAWREMRGAGALAAAGVRVVQPVAIITGLGGRWSEALMLPFVPGTTLDDWLAEARPSQADRRAVFAAAGRQIGSMTTARLANRDYKSTNLMIDPAALDDEPTVLDPAGIRRRTPARVARMFELLRETTMRHAGVTADDFAVCIEAARAVDPTLAADGAGVA